MTAQIPDEFRYEGEQYSLVGKKGSGLFTPEDFGMVPHSTCTACWRGYVMKYDCVNSVLILDEMLVNTNKSFPVNGVEPGDPNKEPNTGRTLFSYTYENLGLKTKFTGSLLLGKDFIQEMYVHMGFQRPMAYRVVLELQIQDGDIISVSDLSKKMEERRLRDPYEKARPETDSDDEIRGWIEEAFSLDYEE